MKFTFVDCTDRSGAIQVLGANGTTATIVRSSATAFAVTINSGTPRAVTHRLIDRFAQRLADAARLNRRPIPGASESHSTPG